HSAAGFRLLPPPGIANRRHSAERALVRPRTKPVTATYFYFRPAGAIPPIVLNPTFLREDLRRLEDFRRCRVNFSAKGACIPRATSDILNQSPIWGSKESYALGPVKGRSSVRNGNKTLCGPPWGAEYGLPVGLFQKFS